MPESIYKLFLLLVVVVEEKTTRKKTESTTHDDEDNYSYTDAPNRLFTLYVALSPPSLGRRAARTPHLCTTYQVSRRRIFSFSSYSPSLFLPHQFSWVNNKSESSCRREKEPDQYYYDDDDDYYFLQLQCAGSSNTSLTSLAAAKQ